MRTRLAFFLAIVVSVFAPIDRAAIAEVNQPTTNWNGFYIGANAGYLKARTKYVNPATPVQEFKGALWGASIGYNFQIKQLVLGIETDGSWGKLDTFIRDG